MNKYRIWTLMFALFLVTSGCGSDGVGDAGSGPIPPNPPFYKVSVTSIDMTNKDSGEKLEIDGLPVDGNILLTDE